MYKIALIFFGLFAAVNASAATGFDIGNELSATETRGNVSVTCPSRWGQQSAYFQCYGEILDPADSARFQTDVPVDADAVELKAIHQDGSTKTKAGGYSPGKSRSTDRFNLWIRTLTQKPLLDYGRNEIQYTMKKNGTVVQTGTFVANVNPGAVRMCRSRHYWSNFENDCYNGDRMCWQYFADQAWCR